MTELRRRRRVADRGDDHGHDHAHADEHEHGHDHAHPHAAGEARDHGHAHPHAADDAHEHPHPAPTAAIHSHGGVAHSHAPAPGSTITWRSLFLLGLAGGLIPSTSALLILLGSIAAGRPAFGFILVVAFGLGMAAVMGGIGFALVAARDRVERVELGTGLARLRETVPLLASVDRAVVRAVPDRASSRRHADALAEPARQAACIRCTQRRPKPVAARDSCRFRASDAAIWAVPADHAPLTSRIVHWMHETSPRPALWRPYVHLMQRPSGDVTSNARF